MKPKSALRSFLALAGSSLLAISYSHAQTILADDYLTSLDVASPTTLSVTPNFPSFLAGPLTGSSDLTITGYFSSASVSAVTNPLSLVNNAGNTFSGNIIVDGSALRIAGNPFATSGGGFVAGSMTSSDTITINRAGILHIDDNVAGGYTANRFGTSGDRPSVNMAGGTINLNGLSNASSSVQTFGALTSSSGQGTLNVFVNGTPSTIRPTLTFSSLAISSGSLLSFNGTALGTGTNDARITFTSAPTSPTLTNGILAGARFYNGSPGTSEFVTYDTNGVRSFTASDYTVYGAMDINGATSSQNVQMTGAVAPVALTADTTVNSLNYNGNAGTWSLGGFKLTLASGMFLRNGNNSSPSITTGTLTAGTGSPIDLNIIIAQHTGPSISAVIADNGVSGVVTLVKSGDGRGLTLNNNSADNTYTGGTYVVGGPLSTGSTANRRYLGTGKAVVDGNSELTLGAIGATSFSGSLANPTYTAVNGAKISISNNNHGSVEFFNIAANSIIAGASGSGTGLASITRGTNITLASGAIIGHSALTAALNTTTGTIQNLGTSADLYYGLNATQNSTTGSINIGSGTAFKGISTDRQGRDWQQGIINIASGTTSVDFQGHATHGSAAVLTLGNGATGGAPVINVADAVTLDINALGSLTLNDSTATYGNTGSGQNVRFVAKAGSTLTVTAATGMGSGTGIASALVNNGGSLAIGNAAALNGAVTVESGGRLVANQASGLTGTGGITFDAGSIIDITNNTGFSGAQATAATVPAGTIVRLNTANPGVVSGTTLDSFLDTKSPIYQIVNDVTMANPSVADTTILTLNKNGSGVGGILTNSFASKTLGNSVNGKITLGANGGVMAGTTNTELVVPENIDGAGTLTIGTTAIIDGVPKLGSVGLGSAANSNTYTGGTIINAGTLRQGYANVLGALTNQLTVNTGGRLNMNGQALTVGNLTGTGGIISGGGATLTIGQGDNGGGNYQGSIQDTNTKLTKTGTNTITLSGANTYTGATTVNGGTLELGVDDCLSNSSNVAIGAATLKAAAGVNDTVGTLDPTAAATINLGDGSTTLAFAASNGVDWTGGTLNITGTFVSGSSLRFGTTSSGLTSTPVTGQLAKISATGWTGFALNASGYLTATPTGGDVTPPTLTGITDNVGGGPVTEDASVTYTVTFSEDIDSASVTTADFDNQGTATCTINSVVETGPTSGVFTVVATPTTPGTLRLRIPTGAVVEDTSGNDLVVPVSDDTTITVRSKYEAWSGASDFDVDTNGDGVDNGLAFLLGAANKNVSALSLLPTVTQSGGDLILEFDMLNSANRKAAALNVQHSSDLGISDAWESALVPNGDSTVNDVVFDITAGSPLNGVQATIPASKAAGGKLFGRLKGNP